MPCPIAARAVRLFLDATAGKLADYVLLADDPHTGDVEKIKDIQVVRTVVGGRISHQA